MAQSDFERMGGTYHLEGDYLIPDLISPRAPKIGIWGMRRKHYLRQYHNGIYAGMLLSGTLNSHLEEIDQAAEDLIFQLVDQMAASEGIAEQLKAQNQMQWVERMNNIREMAIEVVIHDLIMLAENRLIHGFEKNAVICVLQTVEPDYQEHYLNLCEQSITNALGLAIISKNIRTLHLGHAEQAEILEMMQNRSCEQQREFLHVAALSICDQMEITDKWIMDYVTSFSDTLLPRIGAALERMDLSNIFMPSCK